VVLADKAQVGPLELVGLAHVLMVLEIFLLLMVVLATVTLPELVVVELLEVFMELAARAARVAVVVLDLVVSEVRLVVVVVVLDIPQVLLVAAAEEPVVQDSEVTTRRLHLVDRGLVLVLQPRHFFFQTPLFQHLVVLVLNKDSTAAQHFMV
jgi:hypothetical protein